MSVSYNELYLVWYRPQLLCHCRTRVSPKLSFIRQWVPRILWLWNVYPLVRLFASKAACGQSRTSSSAPSWKATKHYLRRMNKINMSAIKTHDVYNVIHGDDLVVAQEGEEKRFKVTSMLLQRDRPSVCQIFTATENTGSLASSETKAFNCKVVSTEPSQHSTKFNLKAVVGTETQEIALTSVKTQSSECTICWLNWIFCFDYIYNVWVWCQCCCCLHCCCSAQSPRNGHRLRAVGMPSSPKIAYSWHLPPTKCQNVQWRNSTKTRCTFV